MRIDKFLKVSRLIKRRVIAKEAIEKGKVLIDGNVSKPGTPVRVGQHITIQFASKKLVIEVTSLSEKQHDLMFQIKQES